MAQAYFDTSTLFAVRDYTAALGVKKGAAPACFVLTFGCQQNVADSEKLSGMAEEMGYRLTDLPAEADLILVNTCAIREHGALHHRPV